MADPADKGNPNFFTLFKGRYNAVLSGTSSTSNVIMLTSTNLVQFLGDCTADDEGNLWVLPEECRPSSPVRLVCPIEPGGDTPGQSIEVVSGVSFETSASKITILLVTPDGSVKGEPNKLHYTNGLMFSISDRWYL